MLERYPPPGLVGSFGSVPPQPQTFPCCSKGSPWFWGLPPRRARYRNGKPRTYVGGQGRRHRAGVLGFNGGCPEVFLRRGDIAGFVAQTLFMEGRLNKNVTADEARLAAYVRTYVHMYVR